MLEIINLLSKGDETGFVTNFSSHEGLKKFLNENSGFLSMKLVQLPLGAKIEEHTHSVDTLMIACKGRCVLTGALASEFKEGDIVVIPKHVEHGLVTDDEGLFWGLSLRFSQEPF